MDIFLFKEYGVTRLNAYFQLKSSIPKAVKRKFDVTDWGVRHSAGPSKKPNFNRDKNRLTFRPDNWTSKNWFSNGWTVKKSDLQKIVRQKMDHQKVGPKKWTAKKMDRKIWTEKELKGKGNSSRENPHPETAARIRTRPF